MNVRTIVYGAVLGALGGAVGWLPGELAAWPRPGEPVWQYVLIALYFVLIGACIGGAVGALDGVLYRVQSRALSGARMGALVGALGGALGSVPGQGAYQWLGSLGLGLMGRAIGWGVVGLLIGLAEGLVTHDEKRRWRGALGGLLGGYLGGGCFEMVSVIMGQGAPSRLIAVVILGALIGALIAFFQEMLAEAWLTVISSGKQEGHKLNLSKPETSLGRDDRNDFVLYAGGDVAARHAVVARKRNGYWLRPLPPSPAQVDGQWVSGEQRLKNQSRITLGGMTLLFREQMVACPQCGKENTAQAQFCAGCGTRFTTR